MCFCIPAFAINSLTLLPPRSTGIDTIPYLSDLNLENNAVILLSLWHYFVCSINVMQGDSILVKLMYKEGT